MMEEVEQRDGMTMAHGQRLCWTANDSSIWVGLGTGQS